MHHSVAFEFTGRRLMARDRARQRGATRPMNVLARAGMECVRRVVTLEAEIAALAGGLRSQKAQLLVLVGEYDELGGWIASGAPSCAHWLAERFDIELCTAREQVRVARAAGNGPSSDNGRIVVCQSAPTHTSRDA